MKQPTSWAAAHVTSLFVLLVTFAVLVIGAPEALAYEDYSGCESCHGGFRSSPYISLSDGANWGDDLHDVHRRTMLNSDCNTCHESSRSPAFMDSSIGGAGLAPISCVGCHGRDEDMGGDSESPGRGAGLRQHHTNAGELDCMDCHSDADPANYTPVGEDVHPNYYASPGNNHPNIPTDPCNPTNTLPGSEGAFAGTLLGLDNDGDGIYDTDDPDCAPIGCQSDAECDDAAFCNGAETCNLGTGQCEPGTPVDVDDGVGCTDDSCDEANDVIVNAPNDGLCDNGLFCDGSETCDAVSDCLAGTPPCDPGSETCNEVGDVCEAIGCQSDAECDDAVFCNGAETCNLGTGQCEPGTPVDVDDGVGCTDDSCDEANDVIVNAPNDGLCDNGLFCDGSETCDAVSDCLAGTAPCDPSTETCDEVGDVCEAIGCQSDAECDDAAFCNGAETCNLGTGQCEPGTPVDVDDGVGCTDDSCDEANDVIVNAPNDGLCDNGAFCDGSETCDAVSDCQAGTPVDVDDGVGCTDDSCDEANDAIVNAPNDSLCDNGLFCDGSETCDAVSDCLAGTAPCDPSTETCDEVGDVCEAIGCQSDAECDDAAFCNGAETCNLGTGQCEPGTPVDVDDGVGCTDDSCDEANDVIVNAPNDGLCDNGAFCDGSETCDAVSDCQAGTPVDADDGVGCTDDSCDEANDAIVNAPNDGLCDNGLFCDGSETCDAVSDCLAGTAPCDPSTETCDEVGDVCEAIGCQSDAECDDAAFCNGAETCNLGTGQCEPGTPVDVDDGVGCTDDSCDEANDVIVNAPNDGLCDNGAFCDGSETCDAINDCQIGTAPCDPGSETCDEAGDICEPVDMLDLDVASLRVTKKVSLTRLKSVGLTLVVKNNGTVEGAALATITGMQNGTEVYNETLTVTDAVGNGRTTYDDGSVPSIPSFAPTAVGNILWTVTIADDDPDNDEVTVVTTIVP